MSHMSSLQHLRSVVSDVEFAQTVRNNLNSVRLIHESDEETLSRMMTLAGKLICRSCRGYGRGMGGGPCGTCSGRGHLGITEEGPNP